MRIEHASLSIHPPITYPDDSVINMDQGAEEGMAYPIRPGQENQFKTIYQPPPPDAANYQFQEKVKNLRKLHFVDHPEQTGDTPPTATQWMDELARAQRRIGTPGMSFWKEGPAQYFIRFKYLLEAAGAIAPLKVDGRVVAALPRNPAQAAADQQEVVKTMQLTTYMAQTFPEEFKVRVDGGKTMQNFVEKARTPMIAWRKAARHSERGRANVEIDRRPARSRSTGNSRASLIMGEIPEIAEALDRIARTADGLILYRHLENQLCAICLDLGHGALRRHEGHRMFARELMRFMAEGIAASGGRSGVILNRRDDGDGQRKRRQSIREYVASQPSWADDASASGDDEPGDPRKSIGQPKT